MNSLLLSFPRPLLINTIGLIAPNPSKLILVVQFINSRKGIETMKSFFATIETETGTYTIDQKPPVSGVTYYAVNWHSGAVYFNSVVECLEWIKEHSEYVLGTAV